jgi:hypothetical protein
VLNRPHSVQQMIDMGALDAIKERFVYIAETDHVLMKPIPNLATDEVPSAYQFGRAASPLPPTRPITSSS